MDMRIDELLKSVAAETKKAPEVQQDGKDFSFTLQKVDQDGLKERLGGLLEDITARGKRLAEHMDIRDMKQYRASIKEFLNEVVNNSHEFSRENFLDRRGRHRVYGIVKLVDKNLDDLAQELMSNEKNSLNILERVDEIRGLLLDITL